MTTATIQGVGWLAPPMAAPVLPPLECAYAAGLEKVRQRAAAMLAAIRDSRLQPVAATRC